MESNIVQYEGDFAAGNTLTLHMKMGDTPTPVQVSVKDLVVNEWLHQGGGYPVILTYDHNWYLKAVPEGTKVTQYEYYTGFTCCSGTTPAKLLYIEGNKNLKARLKQTESFRSKGITMKYARKSCASFKN